MSSSTAAGMAEGRWRVLVSGLRVSMAVAIGAAVSSSFDERPCSIPASKALESSVSVIVFLSVPLSLLGFAVIAK